MGSLRVIGLPPMSSTRLWAIRREIYGEREREREREREEEREVERGR